MFDELDAVAEENPALANSLAAYIASKRAEAFVEAAELVADYIPDPHEDDEGCEDCWLARNIASELSRRAEQEIAPFEN